MSYMDRKNILSEGFFDFLKKIPKSLKFMNSTEKKLYKKDPEFRKDMDNIANAIDRLNKKYGKQYGKYS